MVRAVGLKRVSSASQVEGHSLPAQERLIKEYCKARGWELVRLYSEEGRSAHVETIARRPILKKLLEDAEHGEYDVLVVHSLDRLARNLKVTIETLGILARNRVGLVSITENIDYSRPEGMLFTQMLGAFAQYYSDALGSHVKKGLGQRAEEGKHNGGIPFGYESCWMEGEKGERARRCSQEHPGGIHVHPEEGPAVAALFQAYSPGTTTLSQLAASLNNRGFRTHNTKRLPGPDGQLNGGPKLFTGPSVRGILHNPFYAGYVTYKARLMPGAHEPLVSRETFDLVQAAMRKNSGRSETLAARPEREYLLKGLVRCAYCGMPMWAQTYKNGGRYYREHVASRSHAECPARGGSIPCERADEQVGRLVEAIELGEDWLEGVMAILSLKDELERVKTERQNAQERLRRMRNAYVDGLFTDDEYRVQKRLIEQELEGLVVPEASAAEEAGRLIRTCPGSGGGLTWGRGGSSSWPCWTGSTSIPSSTRPSWASSPSPRSCRSSRWRPPERARGSCC